MANDRPKSHPQAAPKAAPKKRKIACLPPPDEAVEMWKSEQERPKKKKAQKKPITTLEKIAAAKAEEQKKPKTKLPKPSNALEKPKGGRKPKAPKPVGMMAMLSAQDGSNRDRKVVLGKKIRESVLCRPTARAKVFKAASDMAMATSNYGNTAEIETLRKAGLNAPQGAVFPLLKLPPKVRARIWQLCVVFPSFFVRPHSNTGAEQPDLSMTCRQIRDEVLPIFYSENIFAFDITPPAQLGARKIARESDLKMSHRWMKALEVQYRFSSIRKWAFSYADPGAGCASRTGAGGDDKSFIVFIEFASRDQCWRAETVEVHQDGRCLLATGSESGTCLVKKQPAWLVAEVIAVEVAAKRDGITSDSMLRLMEVIMAKVEDLSPFRCETVVKSIEGARTVVLDQD